MIAPMAMAFTIASSAWNGVFQKAMIRKLMRRRPASRRPGRRSPSVRLDAVAAADDRHHGHHYEEDGTELDAVAHEGDGDRLGVLDIAEIGTRRPLKPKWFCTYTATTMATISCQ